MTLRADGRCHVGVWDCDPLRLGSLTTAAHGPAPCALTVFKPHRVSVVDGVGA